MDILFSIESRPKTNEEYEFMLGGIPRRKTLETEDTQYSQIIKSKFDYNG